MQYYGRYSCNPVMFLFTDMPTNQETGPSAAPARKLVGEQSLKATGANFIYMYMFMEPLNDTLLQIQVHVHLSQDNQDHQEFQFWLPK